MKNEVVAVILKLSLHLEHLAKKRKAHTLNFKVG